MGKDRDHILPQFNLKNISSDKNKEKIYGFVKKNKEIYNHKIRKTSSKKDFYLTKIFGNYPDEQNCLVEQNSPSVLNKIFNGELLESIEIRHLYNFIFNRIMRSYKIQDYLIKHIPNNQDIRDFLGKESLLFEEDAINYIREKFIEQYYDSIKMQIIPENKNDFSHQLYISLLSRNICLLENISNIRFVIPDNGFALLNSNEIKFRDVILIPYNEKYCFLLDCYDLPVDFIKKEIYFSDGIINKISINDNEIINYLNRRFFEYSSYITYSKYKEDLDFLKKLIIIKKKEAADFTPESLVTEMLDKLPQEVWSDPSKTFLDPSGGNGNFLVAILKRKLAIGHPPLQALSTIFSVELMADNVKECKDRLLVELNHLSPAEVKEARCIVNRNIVCSDAFLWDFEKWCPIKKESKQLF